MGKSINLILAFIWLTLGVGLLAVYWADRETAGAWEYRGLPGCFGLAMAVYNLVRWRSNRSRGQRPGVDWVAFRRKPPVEEPDSRFQLTDEPPPIRVPPSRHVKSGEERPPADPRG